LIWNLSPARMPDLWVSKRAGYGPRENRLKWCRPAGVYAIGARSCTTYGRRHRIAAR
jgi:hypothetical protein